MRSGRFLAACGLLALMVSPAAPQQPQPPLPAHSATSGHQLVAVLYSKGPKWIEDKDFIEQPIAPHAQYMHALLAQDRLLLGGPYRDNLGELTILKVADFPDARAIVANDPAVQAGILKAELHPWQVSFDGRKDGQPGGKL